MSMDFKEVIKKMVIPQHVKKIIGGGAKITIPETKKQLFDMALGGAENKTYKAVFNVNGKEIEEATVVKCKNGIAVNFDDITMRRRDPNSMVIADEQPTDKPTHIERFGKPFDEIRQETFDWLTKQEGLVVLPFYSGNEDLKLGYASLAIVPESAAFFATMIAELQGFIPASKVPNFFKPKAVIYVAPPFRHIYYEGKQVVVHNRDYDMQEVFSYNLYPGPSAKKGVYSILLDIGEKEGWVTLHASTVKIVTPYELELTIMHEGASGGGKSEMTEPFHREEDGRLLLATNIVSGEKILVNIADTSTLHPITDDMALAHPSLQNNSKKLVVADAEYGWFLRVDHIQHYGTDPEIEAASIHPKEPIIFLNEQAVPDSTCLIWEHIEDAPGKPCANPRIIMPRAFKKNIVEGTGEIDIRSFGVRTPPTTSDKPNYGIIGMFHVLPPALAWIWRLVAPRGYANPSIIDNSSSAMSMKSEGVGSYWPFATGKKVDQANLLLEQIMNTPETRYILVPNQYIGCFKVGFAGQWATREYLSRRGGMKYKKSALEPSRCSLLGYSPRSVKIDGTEIPKGLLQVNTQARVGNEAYDKGAKMLTDFFKEQLKQFDTDDLAPLGHDIIQVCMNDGTVEDYFDLIPVL